MNTKLLGFIFVLFLCFGSVQAQKKAPGSKSKNLANQVVQVIKKKRSLAETENPKAVAAITTFLLGPFGAHRIYLGTDAKVPIFYTLTLGGGLGILPIVDLVCILSAEDISSYYDNPRIFMWNVP